MIRCVLLVAIVFLCSIRTADADLNQYMIRTTEWLVDHSAVICVVKFHDEESEAPRWVLATLKGDPTEIQWPLKEATTNARFFGPPSKGRIRLVYISEKNEILQSVKLRRGSQHGDTLREAIYGVDQHGNLHLTESSLFDCIRRHQQKQPSGAISRRKNCSHFARSGVEAPRNFPLESGDETFVLIVDFNEARRDFYLKQLETGNFTERLHAINELSRLEDEVAYSAIKSATTASNVERTCAYPLRDVDFNIELQNAAKRVVARIRRDK